MKIPKHVAALARHGIKFATTPQMKAHAAKMAKPKGAKKRDMTGFVNGKSSGY